MNRKEAIKYMTEWLKDEYALNGKDREVLYLAIASLKAWNEFMGYMDICQEEAKDKAWGEGCAFAKAIAEQHLENLERDMSRKDGNM